MTSKVSGHDLQLIMWGVGMGILGQALYDGAIAILAPAISIPPAATGLIAGVIMCVWFLIYGSYLARFLAKVNR